MKGFVAGALACLLVLTGGFFIWKSQAESEAPIPPAPKAPLMTPMAQPVPMPPAADAKSKEEKRFARADRDDDGRITRAELLQPREKAFAKLDRNGNGSLSFEEWAVTTTTKFAEADGDRSGWLTPKEYETTKPKARPKPKCAC